MNDMGVINRYMKNALAELNTRTMEFINSRCGIEGRLLAKACTYGGKPGADHKVYQPCDVAGALRLAGYTLSTVGAGVSGTLILDDGANWRITLVFTDGELSATPTIAASSGALASWTPAP